MIGPQRMFGPGSTYRAIQWYWFLGALLPVLFYVLMRLFPRSPARYLSAPVMLGAMGWLPPYVAPQLSTDLVLIHIIVPPRCPSSHGCTLASSSIRSSGVDTLVGGTTTITSPLLALTQG